MAAFCAIDDLTDFNYPNNLAGLVESIEKGSVARLRLALLLQISEKNLFTSLLHQLTNTRNIVRSTEVLDIIRVSPNETSRNALLQQVQIS